MYSAVEPKIKCSLRALHHDVFLHWIAMESIKCKGAEHLFSQILWTKNIPVSSQNAWKNWKSKEYTLKQQYGTVLFRIFCATKTNIHDKQHVFYKNK